MEKSNMRFQLAFLTILFALLDSTAQTFAQGTGGYAAPIPGSDKQEFFELRDEWWAGVRARSTTGSALNRDGRRIEPSSTGSRRRTPAKKIAN
jgi:hypothetical protein